MKVCKNIVKKIGYEVIEKAIAKQIKNISFNPAEEFMRVYSEDFLKFTLTCEDLKEILDVDYNVFENIVTINNKKRYIKIISMDEVYRGGVKKWFKTVKN